MSGLTDLIISPQERAPAPPSEEKMMADLAKAHAAGETQLAQRIAEKIKAGRAPPPSTGQIISRGFLQGASMGAGEEMGAAYSASQKYIKEHPEFQGVPDADLYATVLASPEDYRTMRDQGRQENAAAQKAGSKKYLASQILGALAPGAVAALGTGGSGALAHSGHMLKGALAVGEGALQGAGYSEAEDAPGVARDTAVGTGLGLAGYGALRAAGGAISGAARKYLKPVLSESDPVAQQIARVSGNAPAWSTNKTPSSSSALPKALDFILPEKAKLAIRLVKAVVGHSEDAAPRGNPYPEGATAFTRAPTPPIPTPATPSLSPELQAAAEQSRSSILKRAMASWPEPQAAPPQPAAPAAAMSPAPAAQPAAVTVLQAAKAAPVVNPYEALARNAKVDRLSKAVEANVTAHLGADALKNPQFAENLGAMPPEWWKGMAQVAGVNEPSPESILQVTQYFRNRAAGP